MPATRRSSGTRIIRKRSATCIKQFVGAGADIIFTNTFGLQSRHRLKLHKAEGRVYELAKMAAEIACEVADAAPRDRRGRGSIGPTGELFEPLGALTERPQSSRSASCAAGSEGWRCRHRLIETMSAAEEIPRRAATAAHCRPGLPYTATLLVRPPPVRR